MKSKLFSYKLFVDSSACAYMWACVSVYGVNECVCLCLRVYVPLRLCVFVYLRALMCACMFVRMCSCV